MFSVIDIVRRDAATHYSYDNHAQSRRVWPLMVFSTFAIGSGFLVGQASNEFLGGALSAQAILVGFSFNVLFYLVANRLSKPHTFVGMEHELRFERLSKLSDEIFDNVTYFNFVAIFSAIVALILLLFASDNLAKNLHHVATFVTAKTGITQNALSWSKWTVSAFGLSLLMFLIAESVYTFLRAVGRVRFYFTMLKTMNDDVQA